MAMAAAGVKTFDPFKELRYNIGLHLDFQSLFREFAP
jgi:hypothetical protein